MPQGSLKKIEINLLLADLGFQLGNVLARRRQIRRSGLRSLVLAHHRLARPASLPYPFSPANPEPMAPFVKMLPIYPELP